MTVSELIEKLQKCPPYHEIGIVCKGSWSHPTRVTIDSDSEHVFIKAIFEQEV
jgi:hypothetical protein